MRLYRYLVTASALLLLATLVVSVWYYYRQATQDLFATTARHNLAINRLLSNDIWNKYEAYLAAAGGLDAGTLKSRPETTEIDRAIRVITEGIGVLKVKIYSPDAMIVFSTEPGEIGGDYSHSNALQLALREGRSSSALSYEEEFTAFSGEKFQRDVVETYLPRFDRGGKVVAVLELYTDVSELTERIKATALRMLTYMAAVFGTAYLVLTTVIMRRAIDPINRASEQAAMIGPKAPDLRLPTGGMPKEILPLVRAINDAFDRLDRAMAVQQRFAEDAAHELLTPLAVLRAQVYALDDEAVARPLRDEIDAMTDIVNQLLLIAELDAQRTERTGERSDLRAVAAEVVANLAPVAVREGKEISLAGAQGPVAVTGSPKAIAITVRNVLKNAIRHAPRSSTIDVDVSELGEIAITDRGEGVPVEMREKIFERFYRGGSHNEPGAGLGLAIVKSVVDKLGGQISVDDAPDGGAQFRIQFKLAGQFK